MGDDHLQHLYAALQDFNGLEKCAVFTLRRPGGNFPTCRLLPAEQTFCLFTRKGTDKHTDSQALIKKNKKTHQFSHRVPQIFINKYLFCDTGFECFYRLQYSKDLY